jgi:RNA polymerase sigma-70 factor (ECF subfamily)
VADDRELWERICRGDTRAFDGFYLENVSRLNGFLRQLLGDMQTAEDVGQETFLQLWRRPNGFHPENGSLRAYLFGIGKKRAAEWWRQRTPTADEQETVKRECNTETASLVGDSFSRLGTDERTLLWLREVEGQSYAELAEILDIPVGTVKSRLFAAREELRRIWHSSRPEKKVGL